MFRERDSYWRDQIEANNKLNTSTSQPVIESREAQLRAAFPSDDVSEYINSVCNNQILAREIRETLQILLMREKNDIEILKESTIRQVDELESRV